MYFLKHIIKGEATAQAFTHHSSSRTHTTQGLDWSPFAAGDSSELMGAPFRLLTHTHTLTQSWALPHPSGSNLGFPKQSLHTPEEFIKWYSGVKQLELCACREGPQTKKTLGNYTLTV